MQIQPKRFEIKKRNYRKFSDNYFIVFNKSGWDSIGIDGTRLEFAREMRILPSNIIGYYLGLGMGHEWAIFFVSNKTAMDLLELKRKFKYLSIERDIWDFDGVLCDRRLGRIFIQKISGDLSDFIDPTKLVPGGWIDGAIRWINNDELVTLYPEYGFLVTQTPQKEESLPEIPAGKFQATPHTINYILMKGEQKSWADERS